MDKLGLHLLKRRKRGKKNSHNMNKNLTNILLIMLEVYFITLMTRFIFTFRLFKSYQPDLPEYVNAKKIGPKKIPS